MPAGIDFNMAVNMAVEAACWKRCPDNDACTWNVHEHNGGCSVFNEEFAKLWAPCKDCHGAPEVHNSCGCNFAIDVRNQIDNERRIQLDSCDHPDISCFKCSFSHECTRYGKKDDCDAGYDHCADCNARALLQIEEPQCCGCPHDERTIWMNKCPVAKFIEENLSPYGRVYDSTSDEIPF